MSSTPTRLRTADDLLSGEFTGRRVELIEGEIREMTPASEGHGYAFTNLMALLVEQLASLPKTRRNLLRIVSADTGYVVSRNPDSVLAPDLAIVSAEKTRSGKGKKGFCAYAPDIAIEILSPSNTRGEMLHKAGLYLEGGSEQVWLIDPETEAIEVHSSGKLTGEVLHRGDTIAGVGVLEGVTLEVNGIFG